MPSEGYLRDCSGLCTLADVGSSWLWLLLSGFLWAQLQEDFSDGDFTNNPTWSGTDAYWTITGDKRLRSNGPSATATLYLSTANSLIDNVEWRFWVRVAFNPSTQNFVRIYLVADRADLTDPDLNGYYLKLGGISGSLDSLELWLQQGATHTRLAGGIPGRFGGTNNILWVRVLRSNAGLWEAYTDTAGYWEAEFTVTDNTLATTSHFGVYFAHTSTNRQNLWLDDFYIGPPLIDMLPPHVVSGEVASPTQIRLTFSEAVEPTSATTVSNYTLTPGPMPITAAVRPTPNTVELTLGQALAPSQAYTLTYNGIQDMAGNAGSGSYTLLLPEAVAVGDLIFSEIMAKPTPPVGLPPYEYCELYNASAKWLQLQDVRFCDAIRCVTLPNWVLGPGDYVLLVPAAAAGDYPGAIALSSWPTLNDSGDSLSLWGPNDEPLDAVMYSASWYRSSSKAQGGWSLERIDLSNRCATDSNWTASEDPRGGTPGAANSVAGTWQDQTPPALVEVRFRAADEMILRFSEPLDTLAMQNLARYTLIGGPAIQQVSLWEAQEVLLKCASPIPTSTDLVLQVLARDCMGNEAQLSYPFGLPEPASPFDVVLTEIMADPDPPVGLPPFEYVELHNRSGKWISLEGWTLQIGRSARPLPNYLLRPGAYVAITSQEGAIALAPYGPVIGLTSFPAVPNTGATIVLTDAAEQLVESVSYSIDWYDDPTKKEGGWSLERRWVEWACGGAAGWGASVAALGGTPGQLSSLRQPPPPPAPRIVQAYSLPPQVYLRFSERMDSLALADVAHYVFWPEVPLLAATPVEGGFAVEILPMVPLQENTVYRVAAVRVSSCAGEVYDTLWAEVVVPAPIQPGDVVINEILPEPQSGGARYVELYNPSDKLVDVGGLMLARGSPPTRWQAVASQPVLLAPGGYLCLSADTSDVKERYLPPSEARFHQMRGFPAYDYSRDTVWLLRASDSVPIEYVPYVASAYHFSDLRSRKGVALERLSPELPATDPQNWYSAASSVRYGTPGYANSQRFGATLPEGLRVEPKTFSPDGDGYDDLLWLYVPASAPGTKLTATVHTLSGAVVRRLVEAALLEVGENRFRWEGTDAQGRRLPAGVYVIEVLLMLPEQGKGQRYRLLCAIAERIK